MTTDGVLDWFCCPARFDYGRKPHQVEISEHGAVLRSEDLDVTVHGIAPEGASVQDLDIAPLPESNGLRWTRTMREGESGGVVLESIGCTGSSYTGRVRRLAQGPGAGAGGPRAPAR